MLRLMPSSVASSRDDGSEAPGRGALRGSPDQREAKARLQGQRRPARPGRTGAPTGSCGLDIAPSLRRARADRRLTASGTTAAWPAAYARPRGDALDAPSARQRSHARRLQRRLEPSRRRRADVLHARRLRLRDGAAGPDACGAATSAARRWRQAFAAAWADGARRAVAQRPPRRARRLRRLAVDVHRHRAPTARASRPTASTCSPSGTARSSSRTRFASRGRTCRASASEATRRRLTGSRGFGAASAPPDAPPTTRATTRSSPPTPARGSDYAPTYWVATAGTPPEDDGPIAGDIDADVAIIGSGFTGISTALYLAQEHGIRAVVLEANQVVVGLLEPQRRPGPERERAAQALAVDRALGPRRRAAARRRDPRPASRPSRR